MKEEESFLARLQREQKVWAYHNFGPQRRYESLLGIVEELGELAHAHLKQEQGIRGVGDKEAQAKDAIGDMVIFLVGYCNSRGYNLQQIIGETWAEVRRRDWKLYPETGLPDDPFEERSPLSYKEFCKSRAGPLNSTEMYFSYIMEYLPSFVRREKQALTCGEGPDEQR